MRKNEAMEMNYSGLNHNSKYALIIQFIHEFILLFS